MSECQLTCAPVVGCKTCGEAKRIVEGECCALAYNDDTDWFDDEDEEFYFGDSSWFHDAFMAGMKERDEMLNGYKTMEQDCMVVVFSTGKEIKIENPVEKTTSNIKKL
jgi:hypothetical protein